MRKYFRLMLGEGSKYVNECLDGSYVGVDFNFNEDLKPYLVQGSNTIKIDLIVIGGGGLHYSIDYKMTSP